LIVSPTTGEEEVVIEDATPRSKFVTFGNIADREEDSQEFSHPDLEMESVK